MVCLNGAKLLNGIPINVTTDSKEVMDTFDNHVVACFGQVDGKTSFLFWIFYLNCFHSDFLVFNLEDSNEVVDNCIKRAGNTEVSASKWEKMLPKVSCAAHKF